MSNRLTDRIIGVLFLLAFPLYGGGQALATSGSMGLGLGLILANSFVVIAIGILTYRRLHSAVPVTAIIYGLSRLAESVLLAAGGLALMSGHDGLNDTAYRIAMTTLAIASLPFCRALFVNRLIPRFLAVLGFAGYLLLGIAMTNGGLIPPDLGMGLLLPGALFEIVFAIWLIVVGLKLDDPD